MTMQMFTPELPHKAFIIEVSCIHCAYGLCHTGFNNHTILKAFMLKFVFNNAPVLHLLWWPIYFLFI